MEFYGLSAASKKEVKTLVDLHAIGMEFVTAG